MTRAYAQGLGEPIYMVKFEQTGDHNYCRVWYEGPYSTKGAAKARRTYIANHHWQVRNKGHKLTATVYGCVPDWEEVLD